MRANQLIFGGKILLVFLDWILILWSQKPRFYWAFLVLFNTFTCPGWANVDCGTNFNAVWVNAENISTSGHFRRSRHNQIWFSIMSCFRPLRHKEWIFSKKLEMKKSHACVPLNLGVLKIYRGPVYYHERKESINPQLLKKSPNLPAWGAPKSILLGNFGRALINPPRQLLAHPYQSVRQQTTTSPTPT